MDEIDWTRLWLLNRTVYMRCQTYRLTHDPEREPWGYWSFPGRPALTSGLHARVDALRHCIEDGLIEVYPDSWLQDPRFRPGGALHVDQCNLDDEQLLKCSEAVATRRGHEVWKAEFEPDWRRYWHIASSTEDKERSEATFWVEYASNDILDELLKYLPSYLGLDEAFGLKEEGCHTYFAYQATKWEVLPSVKVVTWKGLIQDRRFSTLLRLADGSVTEADRLQLQQRVAEHFTLLRSRCEDSVRILTRLSGKWDCHWEPDAQRHDSMPVLRVTGSE